MSTYNMAVGYDPMAGYVLHALSIDHESVPRFRDAYIDLKTYSLVVFTRTGGGNREWYSEATKFLRAHPLFIVETDWEVDKTFAEFHFNVPAEDKEKVEILAKSGLLKTPTERFNAALEGVKR